MYFLGIDIGTSAIKLALFKPDGSLYLSATKGYKTHYAKGGVAEQSPEDWWGALICTLGELYEKGADPSSISAISVAGQSWSAVLVDEEENVLTDSPIWIDTRSTHVANKWRDRLGQKRIFDISLNPFFANYTLPKLLYLNEHEPELIKKARFCLQSNSFIVHRLTGENVLDVSMAYGYANFNPRTLDFDDGLTREFGLPARFFPKPVQCHEIAGKVSAKAASVTGLVEGTPVVVGGLDAACATFGVGVTREGSAQEQSGQAGGMSICLSEPKAHESLILSPHVCPGKWLLQGGSVGGGASLKWFAAELFKNDEQKPSQDVFAQIDELAALSPAGANGVIFLPYLAGERSPIWDSDAKGMYFGIKYANTRSDFSRATMEGVAYSLRHNIETAKLAGADVVELISAGGCAKSEIWTQIKSDVTGLEIHVGVHDAATTLGAAMLGMVALKVYKTHDEAADAIVKSHRVYEPNHDQKLIYDERFELYKELYEATSHCMKKA